MLRNIRKKIIDFLAEWFGVTERIRKLEIKLDEKQEVNEVLKQQVNELQDEVDEMEEKLHDPTEYLKRLADEEHPWFDWKELKKTKQQGYFKTAESLRNNSVFKNELNKFIATSAKSALHETEDFQDLLRLRSAVSTMKSFKEHIMKRIPKPGTEVNSEPDEPHAAL